VILESTASPLAPWESFYVIVGSSGAALIGLQFVVLTLIADSDISRSRRSIGTFGTPIVAHFGTALLISATMSAPWPSMWSVAWVLKVVGVAGIGYVLLIWHSAARQTEYRPVWEDWLWHVILPLVAYGTLVASAFEMLSESALGLFGVGASALLLLFIGIHNAWDTVTYVVTEHLPSHERRTEERTPPSEGPGRRGDKRRRR
jgi:hypothetical protein